jgi:hypothetical protein
VAKRWNRLVSGRVVLMGAALAGMGAAGAAGDSAGHTYRTNYYVMKTDVPEDMAREAQLRLDRMFEEYTARTAGFSRPSKDKLPVFLFTRKEDYHAAGGAVGSGGVFMVTRGNARLMAIAKSDERTWHVLQHEGFHQFAYMSIAEDLPVWVNEGLAEYFGEGIFTGDAFVTGLVPDDRREAVAAMIADGTYTPFAKFVAIGDEEWTAKIKHANYDQAWSMAHFLAQGDNGKYQKAFAGYMEALSRGTRPDRAWAQQFGVADGDVSFEKAWKKYWTELPAHPTRELYAGAQAQILTSFLARAAVTGKKFTTFGAFLDAAKAREIKLPTDPVIWLPPALLEMALDDPWLDAADFIVKWTGNVPTLTEQYGEDVITVEYKGARTVATVKKAGAATAPATKAGKGK